MSVPPCHPSLRKIVRERHSSGITKFAYSIVQCKRCDILVGDVTRGGYLSLIRRLEFDYTLIFFVCGRFIAVSGADKILHKAIIYPFDWPCEGKFPTAGHRRVSVLRHRDSCVNLVGSTRQVDICLLAMLDEFTLRISTVLGQHTSCCPTKKRTLPFCCSSFRDRHVIVALIEQNCPDRARGIEDLFVPNYTRNDSRTSERQYLWNRANSYIQPSCVFDKKE